MKQRGQFETESADFLLRFLPSRNGKYLCGQFAGKKVNRHLQMMVTSAISMVLCCTMFLGTTMAWFTDSVITAGNRIIIGTLKVDLQYNGDSLNPEKNSSPPDVFATTPDVWVPGKFVVRKLTVVNEGDLPIGYELNLLPSNHTLAKYFDVYIPASNADLQNLSETPSDNWTRVDNLANLSSVYSGTLDAASEEHPLTEDVIIGLHMVNELGSTTVASELFGKDFTLHINLLAYQKNMDSQAVDAANAAEQEAALAAIAAQETTRATETETETETKFSSSYKLTKPSGSTSSSNTSTETGDDNEAQTGEDNQIQSDNDNQTQTGEGNQTQSGVDNQTQTGNGNESQTGNDNESLTGNGNESLTGNDNESQTGNGNETQTGNDNETQTGNGNESQTGNDNETQTGNGDESTASSQSLEEEVPDGSDSPDPEANIVADGDTTKTE